MLVTGASRRVAIGAAIARRLVADGACVMLHSWSPHDQEQSWEPDPGGRDALVAELRAAGGRVEHIAADLADPDAPDVWSTPRAGPSGTWTASWPTTPAAASSPWSN